TGALDPCKPQEVILEEEPGMQREDVDAVERLQSTFLSEYTGHRARLRMANRAQVHDVTHAAFLDRLDRCEPESILKRAVIGRLQGGGKQRIDGIRITKRLFEVR